MAFQRSTVKKLLVWPAGLLVAAFAVWILGAGVVYPDEYVTRMLAWRESDVGDYLNHFPQRRLAASPQPFRFESAPDRGRVAPSFESIMGVDNLEAFLESTQTQAFIVIHDDQVLYEEYFGDMERDSMVTSFSVAKSFDSALIGIAIDEGLIGSVDDPITEYLPELADRDERFRSITIRHLLTMSSGLEFEDDRFWLFNGDGPLTTYHPDQRELALTNTKIADLPGEHFQYNKYHPQLLGMILERVTGMSVTEYTQRKLWDPLGMEFDGAWSLDSTESGFEKMEAGLNARAIDFAKFGRLFLNEGRWNGVQIVSADWVRQSIEPDLSNQNDDYYSDPFGTVIFDQGEGWYKYMWYGRHRDGGEHDFAAEGDHGQIIYVSPAKRLIVVRNGFEYGIAGQAWVDAFYRFATEF